MRYEILAAVIILIVLGAATYYYFEYRPSTSGVLSQIVAAYSMINSGNSGNATSSLTEVVENNPIGPTHDYGVLLLGKAYLSASSTAAQGAEILRNLSIDQVAQPYDRSAAAFTLINGTLSYGASFATQNVFTGPTWSGFLSTTTSVSQATLNDAYVNAAVWASDVYSLSTIEYWLANWYSASLFGGNVTTQQAQELIAETNARITKGDNDMQTAQQSAGSSNQQDVGTAEAYKAAALGNLYLYNLYAQLPQNIELSDVQSAYQEAIATLEQDPADIVSESSALNSRIQYAYTLAWSNPTTYASEIQSTLLPVINPSPALQNAPIYATLSSLGQSANAGVRGGLISSLIRLGQSDSSFATFLVSHGWNQSIFNS